MGAEAGDQRRDIVHEKESNGLVLCCRHTSHYLEKLVLIVYT